MSEPINDGGPAFPQPNHIVETDRGTEEARGWMQDSGMTLRDWFAGQALKGSLASQSKESHWAFAPVEYETADDRATRGIAALCYALADAMLKARGGGK
jgi:hypothetical protein